MIQFSISTVFFVLTQMSVKAVLFQAIQFILITKISFLWPIDRTLLGATTPGQSGRRSDVSEEVILISQSSSITGASLSDF